MANPTPPQLDQFLGALRYVESGGDYQERNGQGAYQILQSNWPTWAKRYAGYETADPNASDAPPEIQDTVARGAVTADYYGAAGQDYVKVAEIWNGGEPYPVPNPALGPGATTADYAARVMTAMGNPQAAQQAELDSALSSAGTAADTLGKQVNNSGNDWITGLDDILNPDLSIGLNVLKDLGTTGKALELVAVRGTLAAVGLVMFGGGLLLAFGKDIFGAAEKVAPAAAAVAPEAAAAAAVAA